MSPMRINLAGVATRGASRRTTGWGVRAASVLALVATLLAAAVIWLTLSRPLDVVGALAAEDGWRIAVALGRLLAGTAARLTVWL